MSKESKPKKQKVELKPLDPVEATQEVRNLRAGGLQVMDMRYVDAVLQCLDDTFKLYTVEQAARKQADRLLDTANTTVEDLTKKIHQLMLIKESDMKRIKELPQQLDDAKVDVEAYQEHDEIIREITHS